MREKFRATATMPGKHGAHPVNVTRTAGDSRNHLDVVILEEAKGQMRTTALGTFVAALAVTAALAGPATAA
jgi:hypothetical protein